jgi:cell division septum initiation protein DivIVA
MTTWESALPPSAVAGSLNLPTFATVRRGYDPHQVLEYVTRLTDRLDALSTEVRQLQAELGQREIAGKEQAPTAQDRYEGVGARMADLMRTFDHDVERHRQDAAAEARDIIAQARSQADRIKREAETLHAEAAAKAERVQSEARMEADGVLSGLASRREALMEELLLIWDRMVEATKGIEATIEAASAEDQIVVVEDAEAGTAN